MSRLSTSQLLGEKASLDRVMYRLLSVLPDGWEEHSQETPEVRRIVNCMASIGMAVEWLKQECDSRADTTTNLDNEEECITISIGRKPTRDEEANPQA